jgi:hypothetical protein
MPPPFFYEHEYGTILQTSTNYVYAVDHRRHLVGCDALLDSSSDEILKFFVTHLNDQTRKPSALIRIRHVFSCLVFISSNDRHQTPSPSITDL